MKPCTQWSEGAKTVHPDKKKEFKMRQNEWPNKSLQPTPDGTLSFSRSGGLMDVTGSAWLSSGRSAS
jgi:hypothetical protein